MHCSYSYKTKNNKTITIKINEENKKAKISIHFSVCLCCYWLTETADRTKICVDWFQQASSRIIAVVHKSSKSRPFVSMKFRLCLVSGCETETSVFHPSKLQVPPAGLNSAPCQVKLIYLMVYTCFCLTLTFGAARWSQSKAVFFLKWLHAR